VNSVDVAILCFLAIGLISGARRGFFGIVFSLASWVGALVLAFLWREPVAKVLDARFDLTPAVSRLFAQSLAIPGTASAPAEAVAEGGRPLGELLAGLPVPETLKPALIDKIDAMISSGIAQGATLGELVLRSLAGIALNAIAFLLIFIAARLVLGVVARWLASGLRHVVGSGPNLLGGAAVGAAQNALLTAIALGLVTPLVAMGGFASAANALASSSLAPFFIQIYDSLNLW